MATTYTKVTWSNTVIGEAATSDGVCGLLALGVEVAGTLSFNTLYRITKLQDLEDLGVDAAYDTANNVLIHDNFSRFYQHATDGSSCYLYVIDKATVTMSDFVATPDFSSMLLETSYSNGLPSYNSRIKMLGILFPTDTPIPTGLDTIYSDVIPTVQALQDAITTFYNNNRWEVGFIVDGNNLKSVAECPDFSVLNCPNSHVTITNSNNGVCGDVGMILGILAMNPTQLSLGNALYAQPKTSTGAFFTDGTLVSAYTENEFENILGPRQVGFLRKREGIVSFLYNDSPTSDLEQLSFSFFTYIRLKIKVTRLMYEFFNSRIETNLLYDPTTGAGDPASVSSLAGIFETQKLVPLLNSNQGLNGTLGTGEVIGYQTIIDAETFFSTGKLNVTVVISPPRQIKGININASFGTTTA
jgi:hypothetical protein